jgi:rhamnulokinase
MLARVQAFCRNTGQEPPGSVGDVVRCILASLAFKYRYAIGHLDHILGVRTGSLNIVGGGTRNDLLNRLTANAIGRPVIAGPSEATAIGNLLMQLHACGELKDIGEMRALVRDSFPVQTYEPQPPAGNESDYGRFLKVLEQGKALQ